MGLTVDKLFGPMIHNHKASDVSDGDATWVNVTGDTMTGDLIGTDFVSTRDGTVTRSGGQITEVIKTGGRTITINRTGGLISSVEDGTRTWTFTRDVNDQIESWEVT